MKKSILKPVFVLVFTTFTALCFAGFLGDLWDGAKGIAGGILGLPGDLATGSSIDNMQNKLNGNIDSLDRVMARNAKQFSSDLHNNIVVFGDILKLREEQLDSVFNRNIKELNSGISNNITQLDNSIQNGINGLRSVESFFARDLWVWTKLLAELVLFLIVIYFIFKTYQRVNRRGGLNKQELKELIAESKFYVVGLFVSLFIIFLFKPLTGKYMDSEFEKQKSIYENNLETALRLFDYKTALVYSTGLTRLEPHNTQYEYVVKKIQLVMDILVLTRYSQISNEELHIKFEYLKQSFDSYKINDPEYYIISALYKRNYYNSKKGYLLAAIDCYDYLNKKEKKNSLKFKFNLEPYAYTLLNIYHLNPYDKELIKEKLTDDKIDVSEDLLSKLTTDTFFMKEIIGYPILHLKQTAYKRLKTDQDSYSVYLEDTSSSQVKNNMADGWLKDLKFVNSSKYEKIYSNQSMIFNDFLAHSLLQNYNFRGLDSLNDRTKEILLQAKSADLINDSLSHLFIFKRFLAASLLKNTKSEDAKEFKVSEMLIEKDFYYSKIDSLTSFQFAIKDIPKTQQTDSSKLNIFRNAIRVSAELNLFYTTNKSREPLSYKYINMAKQYLSTMFQNNSSLSLSLKKEADEILENAFWNN